MLVAPTGFVVPVFVILATLVEALAWMGAALLILGLPREDYAPLTDDSRVESAAVERTLKLASANSTPARGRIFQLLRSSRAANIACFASSISRCRGAQNPVRM